MPLSRAEAAERRVEELLAAENNAWREFETWQDRAVELLGPVAIQPEVTYQDWMTLRLTWVSWTHTRAAPRGYSNYERLNQVHRAVEARQRATYCSHQEGVTHVTGSDQGRFWRRHAVTLRTSEGSHHERWRASDHTLEREVVLVCFPAPSPIAAATLDAARRAAGMEDPRLVRVLDVGTDQGFAFVVEEPLTGAVPSRTCSTRVGSRRRGAPITGEPRARSTRRATVACTTSRSRRAPCSACPTASFKVRGLATEAG